MTSALDTSAPNMARVYNYWLGGKDHFAADRAEAERLVGIYPPLPALVRENRAFLIEAAGWAAQQGIGQFIDLGAGLPASPSVHQAARAVLPAARVAYVDIDPVVLSHAAALLATDDGVTAVNADLRDPAAVLGHEDLRAVINPGRPVCVILGAVVHFQPDFIARRIPLPLQSARAASHLVRAEGPRLGPRGDPLIGRYAGTRANLAGNAALDADI